MKIAEVDLDEANDCLWMGKLMKDLHQQLPPARMKDIRLTKDEAVSNIILSSSQETLRKRRTGLHLFKWYIDDKKLEVKQILTGKEDVILANALTWLEKK
ncbi:MAG: hypothetical protein EZS28_026213 [Streblomastix strix]|uniref:Uncharacterized protein n=1 Tax=Streblomastix strix TaxID=222440 RepID=A0A5J4V7P1_9EUKA|nr:MAG: hypothetical protein EZS28_026213 [Streblomastix strix]